MKLDAAHSVSGHNGSLSPMPPRLPNNGIDLTGRRFGRLVARTIAKVDRAVWWHCDCDCGGHVVRRGYQLVRQVVRGHVTSCNGCRDWSAAARQPRSKPTTQPIPEYEYAMTHAEIAKVLGVSRERVRQIERIALDKLRRGFAAYGINKAALAELLS